jgi:hypothetical protein
MKNTKLHSWVTWSPYIYIYIYIYIRHIYIYIYIYIYMVPNVRWHQKHWMDIKRLTNVLFHDACNCSRLDRWMKHEYGVLKELNRYGNTEGTASKSCPSATLSTSNPIKSGFGSSLGLRSKNRRRRTIFSFRLQCATGFSFVHGRLSWYAYVYYWFYNCNCRGF